MTTTPMFYYSFFQVPVWVVLEDVEGADKVYNWFLENEAYERPWPASSFMDTYMSYAQKGWAEVVNRPGQRNADLLTQAFVEHCKKNLDPYRPVGVDMYQIVRMVRDLPDAKAFAQFFNLTLDTLTPIQLSQLFMVQEIAHPTEKSGHKVWITKGDFDFSTISRLSRRVVTIGEALPGHTPDINILELPKTSKKMASELEAKMHSIMSQVSLTKY